MKRGGGGGVDLYTVTNGLTVIIASVKFTVKSVKCTVVVSIGANSGLIQLWQLVARKKKEMWLKNDSVQSVVRCR